MQHIKYTLENGVATILFCRSEKMNSFNMKMAKEVQEALDMAGDDKAVRAILIAAEGRAFCAGQDLAEAIAPDAPSIDTIVEEQYNPLVRMLRSIEKPIICAVNGVAAGAGANIAIACDMIVAGESAVFIQAFAGIGLIPDSGGTYFLPRLVGLHRATAMMFTGDKIGAQQAMDFGFVYKVAPDDQLFATATALATKLASMPTRAFGLTKRALNRSMMNDLNAQLELEKQLQSEAGKTYDNGEGIRAFLEKRSPIFKGE